MLGARADDVHQQHPQPGERQADHRAEPGDCSPVYYLSLATPEFRAAPDEDEYDTDGKLLRKAAGGIADIGEIEHALP